MGHFSLSRYLIVLFLLALFTVLGVNQMFHVGKYNEMQKKSLQDVAYRRDFFSEKMMEERNYLSRECITFLENVEREAIYFPVPNSTVDKSLTCSFTDSWMSERDYAGVRGHEGTDIMAFENRRGVYPVVSVCDGTVTNLGWLEKGGYRIGVTSNSGTYYYYAHLFSYANLKEGDSVLAGQLLGYMGDSGYGPEGTVGKFAVHLHFGIYAYQDGVEISMNPYYLLKKLEKHKLKYSYS